MASVIYLRRKKRQKDGEEETPHWVLEAWNFLLRKDYVFHPYQKR
jgi:hypothetical protein